MRLTTICTLSAIIGLLSTGQARAGFITISQPDANYISQTNLLAITDPDGTGESSLTDGSFTSSFNVPLNVATVPDNFLTWSAAPFSETSTPIVLVDPISSLDITFSSGVYTFGFEAEPNLFGVDGITASFRSLGVEIGSIPLMVDGNSGARLFAAASDQLFDEVRITSSDQFAIANLRYSTVAPAPEPGTIGLIAAGVLGLALTRKVRRGQLNRQ